MRSITRIADLALPPRCPGCGAVTLEDHQFCASCWKNMRFLGPPWCALCHLPFEYDRGEGACCATCLAEAPLHSGVRAAVAYGPIARQVALKLKYSRRLACAETMARAMVRLVSEDAALLIPVPLHRGRIWSRGYNQSALIARALGKMRGLDVDLEVLTRTRATPILRGLGAKGRAKAVRGAFALQAGAAERLAGKTILLVDDVHTTGATADACTRILLRGGAAKVIHLCWARVVGDVELD